MNFEQTMTACGLMPKFIQADGKWRRCATQDHPKKRNGAYVLYPDGRGYWRNWATDAGVNSWRPDESSQAPKIDFDAIRRQQEADRKRRIEAIHAARRFFAQAQPARGVHPYLDRKGLSSVGCTGLRVHSGKLVVPVYWDDRIISLQTIDADGNKRFWPGAPVKAGAYIIQRPKSAVTAVCEGLATGLAIYQSIPTATVIVAFDAGNLAPVVERLRPRGNVILCADNDHATEQRTGTNPGLVRATHAAGLIGAGVAYPEGIEGTDWADALKEIGEGAKRKIERQILANSRYVTMT